jgi:hypothetical protein
MSTASTPLAIAHEGIDPSRGDGAVSHDEYFGVQSTRSAQLPDPKPLLVNLTSYVLEVIAGARDVEQLMRWVTQDVYDSLVRRVAVSTVARTVTGRTVHRPQLVVRRVHVSEPCDGVVESVVVVQTPVRVRSIAIRLEGMDRRWRASAINVL